MARFIRIYDTPAVEKPGSILGFSRSVTQAANDPFLHEWLNKRGYSYVQESEEQRSCLVTLPKMGRATALKALTHMGLSHVKPEYLDVDHVVPGSDYYDAPGIPLPVNTVSVSHLLIEQPLQDKDIPALGLCLSSLQSIYDGGLRRHFLVDSRSEESKITPENHNNIVFAWG